MHKNFRRVLLLALIVPVLSGAGCSLFRRAPKTTTGTNANVNAGPRIAPEPEGTALTVNATLSKQTLVFQKAYRAPEYRIDTAGEGKEFVVVTFQPLPGNAAELLSTVQESVRLTSGDQTFSPTFVDLPSSDQSKANGSFAFEVETGLKDFRLILGPGQTVTLPL